MAHTTESATLELLGRRVRIESLDSDFLAGLEQCFASAPDSPDSDLDLDVRVECVDQAPCRVETIPDLALQSVAPWPVRTPLDLCGALNQWAVSHTPNHYVFHSGALAKGGRALLLPGNSRSGKSTLTAGMLGRGFQLLSDEVGAVQMSTRRVECYPRLLSIRPDVRDVLHLGPGTAEQTAGCGDGSRANSLIHPSQLGSSFAKRSAPLTTIVLPRYVPASPTLLTRLSGGRALVALFETACSQKQHKARGFRWLLDLVKSIPCYSLEFSQLDQALDQLVQLHAKERSR